MKNRVTARRTLVWCYLDVCSTAIELNLLDAVRIHRSLISLKLRLNRFSSFTRMRSVL